MLKSEYSWTSGNVQSTTDFIPALSLHIIHDFESVEVQVFYTEFYLLSIFLNKQSVKLDKMRKEDGIISPCLICFHEGSNRKEKMSHSASCPIWWFGLWASVTKRGQHSMGFEFTKNKTPAFSWTLYLKQSILLCASQSTETIKTLLLTCRERKEESTGVVIRTQLYVGTW